MRSGGAEAAERRATASSPEAAATTWKPQPVSKLAVACRIACSSSTTTMSPRASAPLRFSGEGSASAAIGASLASGRVNSKQEPFPGSERSSSSQPSNSGQAADDRQTEAEALGLVALRVADLIIFLEHARLLVGRNSDPRVPDLQRDRVFPPPTADEDLPALGVANRVRDEIAQDAFDQHRVGGDDRRAVHPFEPDALSPGLVGVLAHTPSSADRIANGRRSTVTTPASSREMFKSALKRLSRALIDASIWSTSGRAADGIANPRKAPTKRPSA